MSIETAGRPKTALMTEGNIWKTLFFFAVPLILGNLLQQMYNTADSIIVGNCVGSIALAAVGSGTSLIYLLIAFSQGAAVGAGVIVAQHLGSGDRKGVQSAVHTALALAAVLGLLLTAGGIAFSRPLLEKMGSPDEVLPQAARYLQLYSGGMLFNVVYNMAAGILNAAGNSRRSLLYLAAAAVTNIVLDLILIAGLGMGVEGAAIATDVSQAVSCVLALRFLTWVDADYRVELRRLRLERRMALRIITIGLPTGIQNMVVSFSNILVQASVNGYGASAIAGFSAYLKVDGFNILPIMSFSMAATTFVGQNYGAGRLDRVKKGMWVTLAMGILYTACTGVLLVLFDRQIIGLFVHDEAVIDCGALAIHYFCPFYFILSILHGLAGTVRGTGRTIPPMLVLLFSLCLFRVAWIELILPRFFQTIDGIFLLYPVSWAVGAVLMVLYAWKGKWSDDLHAAAGAN